MQISPENVAIGIVLLSVIFLIAPAFLLLYVSLYNRRKKKHAEEKEALQRTFEAEVERAQMEVKEETLKTLGAELHDNIGQILSLTSLTLTSINIHEPLPAEEKIAASVDLTKRAIKEIRDLAQLLNGEHLLQRGLVAAIEFELEYLARLNRYTIHWRKKNMPLWQEPIQKDIILFRLFQESINNSIRHAQATELTIELQELNGCLTLTVTDNGTGFGSTETARSGLGLTTIEKRVRMMEGTVTIRSEAGQGTTVQILVPYP